MKILFINSLDVVGGAAIAAWRMAGGLEKYCGTKNHFIVATKKSTAVNVHAVIPERKIPRLIDSYIVKYTNLFGLQYLWIPFSSRKIIELAKQIKPDVISMHNIHGGYFALPLLKRLSAIAPVVWTLHDMWSFTRNAPYTFGDESWKEMKSFEGEKNYHPAIGLDTGNLLLAIKKSVYAKSNLYIVAPSKWLYDMATLTPVFADKKKSIVPYGIDTDVFRPSLKTTAREHLQIPTDGKWIMFDASWIHADPRKGGENLLQILAKLDERTKKQIHCLVLGRNIPEALGHLKNLDLHFREHVLNEFEMAVFYNAADLVVFSSRADNLPNVLIEATACGTPCVAFDVGGVGDIVEEGITGYCVPPFDTEGFTDKTLELLNSQSALSKLSGSSREFAINKFDRQKTSQIYYQLFQEVIMENRK
jgi:glycosyltransferase involved in cell wall biosynthesis